MARRGSMDLMALRKMISGYRNRYASLKSQLTRIEAALDSAESEVAAIQGNGSRVGRPRGTASMRATRGGGGRRPKGQDLASMIAKALGTSGKPMRIPAIVSAVKRAGYMSASPAFSRIVGMRLMDRKRFKRVGRGVYSLAK